MSTTGEGSRAIQFVLTGVAAFALGWFVHGKVYGSDVNIGDSAKQSQNFVNAATKATTAIVSAEGKATTQRERTRERIEHAEAVTTCPPGLGAVSPDMEQRLRAAFGPPEG